MFLFYLHDTLSDDSELHCGPRNQLHVRPVCKVCKNCHNHMYVSKLRIATLTRVNYDPAKAGWEQEYRYEPDVEGLVTVMNKTDGKDIHQVTNDN